MSATIRAVVLAATSVLSLACSKSGTQAVPDGGTHDVPVPATDVPSITEVDGDRPDATTVADGFAERDSSNRDSDYPAGDAVMRVDWFRYWKD